MCPLALTAHLVELHNDLLNRVHEHVLMRGRDVALGGNRPAAVASRHMTAAQVRVCVCDERKGGGGWLGRLGADGDSAALWV